MAINCPCCTCVESGCCGESYVETCADGGGSYDIDLIITSPTQSGAITGTKTIRPAIKKCGTCSKVDASAYVRTRVLNSTSKCIHVQFSAVFGGTSNCKINDMYNCSAPVEFSPGSGSWFYFCMGPGDYFNVTQGFFLGGTVANGCCALTTETISSWTYACWCLDAVSTPTDDCCGCVGCPAC